jgi:hypothetical protein
MVCSTPTFSVYQQGNHVLVNGQSLISQGNGGFLGDGALVIKPAVAGNQIAGASFQVDGEIGTGRCELRSLNAVLYENCQFSVGDRQFSSQDTFDLGQSTNWTRLYSDGVRVNISVPSNAQVIPVPFPVGESG